MNEYNCGPLIVDANFEVPISKNIFWIPVNKLGVTEYTNDEIKLMVNLLPCLLYTSRCV